MAHASAQPDMQAPAYDAVHKALHWLLFVLVIAQFIVGLTMPDITSIDTVEGAWLWHLALGPTILFFAVLKLVWRILHPVSLTPGLPAWQRRLARATHDSLYGLLIVIPILGWAAASGQNMDAKVLGMITLPRIAPPFAEWADQAGDVHIGLVYVLFGLVCFHAAAALYHYFIRRDRVLQRMLP